MFMKLATSWYSDRLKQNVNVVRFGHFGQPILLFPTAGGDAEECERFLMIRALDPLLQAGRIKIYSCDSVAGRVWIDGESSGAYRARVQNLFDAFVYRELVPAIRNDCQSPHVEIITAGASIGAFNALASLCRHPDVFSMAICMSGTYDLSRWTGGHHTFDHHVSSPLHFLPHLNHNHHLEQLQRRFILLACGEGRWESPQQSWQAARVLGSRGIPNRVDMWGPDHDHDWMTWREMLPKYLAEHT